MKRAAFLLIPLLAGLPLPALADCQAIVERTVAELRAAYPDWDERMETLARTAAGSACVKAGNAGSSAAAPGGAQSAAMTSAAVSGDDGEAGGDGDNEVSARPGKKPYERRREVNDPE